jgi:ribosomal protein S18 acetylase RimI-like enzyme
LQVVEHARQLVRAGEVEPEQSVATAHDHLQDLRADRLREDGHEVLVARAADDGSHVGWVWLSPAEFLGPDHERTRWLSQITVNESCRGRGWGRAILDAVETHAALSGFDQLWLRVYDWNTVARQLYRSNGYELAAKFATDAHMRKRLQSR